MRLGLIRTVGGLHYSKHFQQPNMRTQGGMPEAHADLAGPVANLPQDVGPMGGMSLGVTPLAPPSEPGGTGGQDDPGSGSLPDAPRTFGSHNMVRTYSAAAGTHVRWKMLRVLRCAC